MVFARRRDLTLVELLVAVTLGMILIGVITFVWIQSNKIFTVTVHRIETYQRLRTILDVMERDLANTNRTVDMEFYVDNNPTNGFFDTGEALLVGTPPQGANFRVPWDASVDPAVAKGEEEFMLAGFQTQNFIYSPVILSPEPYMIMAGYTDNRAYWRDEIYVRTFATVDGLNRPALVHYRLVQATAPGQPSMLRRRIWYLDQNMQLVQNTPNNGGTDRTSVLSHRVADLKFGFYFKETPTELDGFWFHVGDAENVWNNTQQITDLVDEDTKRGFLTARDAPPSAGGQGISTQHDQSSGGQFGNGAAGNAVAFYYEGHGRLEQPDIGPYVFKSLTGKQGNPSLDSAGMELTAGNLNSSYDNFDFPGVRSGDKFFVFDACDDDGAQASGATRYSKKSATEDYWSPRFLTVDTIFSDSTRTYVGVKFREPVNFFRLQSSWLGTETGLAIYDGPGGTVVNGSTGGNMLSPTVGPARYIGQSFNVQYRVGFLPAAFLVRISCDDRFNRKVLPLERVIRLLQQ